MGTDCCTSRDDVSRIDDEKFRSFQSNNSWNQLNFQSTFDPIKIIKDPLLEKYRQIIRLYETSLDEE